MKLNPQPCLITYLGGDVDDVLLGSVTPTLGKVESIQFDEHIFSDE